MRSFKVYNCRDSRDLVVETCVYQGSFVYPSSALARLAECTGSRAWIEKSGNDVTAELVRTASDQIKTKLAEQTLLYDMKYGRAPRGTKR